ncbi:MAG: hypothetical protein RI953_810, partial [Pseudomonadota bacterium]
MEFSTRSRKSEKLAGIPKKALILFAVMVLAAVGCRKSSQSFIGTPETPPIPGGVIPPVPVSGSFLTGVMLEYNGAPVAQAKLTVLDSNFETETSDLGEFALPVEKLNSKTIPLKVTGKDKIVFADVDIPDELVKPVNQARIDAGAPPLAGEAAVQSSPKLPDGSVPKTVFKRKIVLQIPENAGGTEVDADITQLAPVKQKITISSLPNADQLAGKKTGMWTTVDNLSSETSARFGWKNAFAGSSSVRLIFSKSRIELSNWDGFMESAPGWPDGSPGLNVVSDFSACTDSDFRSALSGGLATAGVGQCGILKSGFPFTDGNDVFARLVAETESEIRLSAVFRISPSGNNAAPVISAVAQQMTPLNIPLLNLPVNLSDADTQLSCPAALTVRSSNTALLPNSSIVVGGTAPSCVLSFYPSAAQTGFTTITIFASDGLLTSSVSFQLAVSASTLALSSQNGLRAFLSGTCDQVAPFQKAKTSSGWVRSVTCSAGILSIEIHLPAGGAESVTVEAWPEFAGVPGPSSFATFTRSAFACPAGYVAVPASGLVKLGNVNASKGNANWWLDVDKDFCVMKYPAKNNNGSTYATSSMTGSPWVMIARGTDETTVGSAFKACKDAGPGNYRLISNTQWQTVARNAESVPANWSGGAVGNGSMALGHSDDTSNLVGALANDIDSKPYSGTGNSASDPVGSGWEQRRTQTLSNGELVWDFAGNVWQWVSEDFAALGV